jgi:hypothetical protein
MIVAGGSHSDSFHKNSNTSRSARVQFYLVITEGSTIIEKCETDFFVPLRCRNRMKIVCLFVRLRNMLLLSSVDE